MLSHFLNQHIPTTQKPSIWIPLSQLSCFVIVTLFRTHDEAESLGNENIPHSLLHHKAPKEVLRLDFSVPLAFFLLPKKKPIAICIIETNKQLHIFELTVLLTMNIYQCSWEKTPKYTSFLTDITNYRCTVNCFELSSTGSDMILVTNITNYIRGEKLSCGEISARFMQFLPQLTRFHVEKN